jgi:hypothetical protein
MPKLDAETYARAYARALAFAGSRVKGRPWASSDLAEELAQEAMNASFDPARYPWRGDKPLDHHVVNVVKSLLSDRARKAKVRADPAKAAAADEALKRSALPADGGVRARERGVRQDERHRWMLAELQGLARAVYLLYVDEVVDAAAQSNVLGKPIAAIYEARRRVAEAAQRAPDAETSSPDLAGPGDDDDGDGDGDEEQEAP